jgi:cellulose synthase/poly-beta-1,6-N-acetylglucosamine synthase-like glycosyltransferase
MSSIIDLSIIVPIRGHESTVASTVEALLAQEFEGTYEVVVVIDNDNGSYQTLRRRFPDPRLRLIVPDGVCPLEGKDSNWRRGLGLRAARGRILALVDADIIFDADWARCGVDLLREHEVCCVAGTMSRARGGFWPGYVDNNLLFPKTPRFVTPYILTRDNFGLPGRKPGVTANMFFTRELFETVGSPPVQFVRSYQDYSFFWEIVSAGYSILCTPQIAGRHYHRERIPDLITEYWMSGLGCSDFIRYYPQSRFSKRRITEVTLSLALAAAGLAGLIWLPVWTLAAVAVTLALAGIWTALKIRAPVGVLYPLATVVLGAVFSFACVYGLLFDRTSNGAAPCRVASGCQRRSSRRL